MKPNQVVIVPAYDQFDLGRHQDNYSEHDIINAYVEPLQESLENDRIICDIRHKANANIDVNTLIIYCLSGWSSVKNGSNYSTIYYSKNSKKAAEFLVESVSEWGKCYIDTGHKTRERKMTAEFPFSEVPGTMALAIEPFVPGGPRHDDYIKRLPKLGELLSHAIFGLFADRQELRA